MMHKENPEETLNQDKLDALDKKCKSLLQLTSKLAMLEHKAAKNKQDLERSVAFMRSALFAIQTQFAQLTENVSN